MKKTKVDNPPTKLSSFKIDPHIHKYLLRLGIPCHLEGYRFVAYIIQNYAELVPEWKFTYLYAKVGKELNSTGSRVERALRHTILKSWRHITIDSLRQQFRCDNEFNITPTVSHYLTAICYDYVSTINDCESEG